MKLKVKLTSAVSAIALSLTAVAVQADVLFWSTQAKPVEEAQAMRDQVLSGADMAVDYQPNDGGPWLTRLNAELQAGSGSIGVLGALHGDFSAMDDADLVDWLAAVDDGLDSIAIIGHNPAMTDLANFLCPSLTLSNLPTAGWLWFSFDDCSWGNSVRSPARGNCRVFYTPKSGKLL